MEEEEEGDTPMTRKLAALAALVAIAALAFAASATSSVSSARASRGTAAAPSTTTQVGAMTVRLQVKRFVKRGHRLYAVGTAVAQFKPTAEKAQDFPTKTVLRSFTAPVRKLKRIQSAQRICPILDLTLGPLDLNLLGLMVHLDQTHLTITADSEGGLLGSLLCSLAGRGGGPLATLKAARTLSKAAHRSGLATRGVRLSVPLYQTTSGSGTTTLSTTKSPLAICTVLDLTLGPLDLNLLGLMVHLSGAAPTDPVHLLITADSEGGILGSLLCSLAGGGSPR
jgi:hypothetical protein